MMKKCLLSLKSVYVIWGLLGYNEANKEIGPGGGD